MATLPTVTVSTTQELRLKPTTRTHLLKKLRLYAELDEQIKVLEAAKSKAKAEVEAIRDETGEQSIAIDGYTVTLVTPVREVLSTKKLLAQGVTEAMLQNATEHKPSKPYCKVTVPGKSE